MDPIKGLLKKDYRISKLYFLIWFGAVLILLLGGIGLSHYTNQPAGTLFVLALVGASLVLFHPIMMYSLLTIEGKNQLWLYSPRSSYTLFLSKLAIISFYQVFLQLLLTLYGTISIYWLGTSVFEQLNSDTFITIVLFANIAVFVTGIYFTCWVLFYWTLYHTLKSNPKVRSYRWIIIVLIYFGYNIFEVVLMQLAFVQTILTRYQVDLAANPMLNFENEQWNVMFETVPLPIVPIIYYVILALILFLISSKLLERKVEV